MTTPSSPTERIAIVGLNETARRLARLAATAGHSVTIFGSRPEAVGEALGQVMSSLQGDWTDGRLTNGQTTQSEERLAGTTEPTDLDGATIFILATDDVALLDRLGITRIKTLGDPLFLTTLDALSDGSSFDGIGLRVGDDVDALALEPGDSADPAHLDRARVFLDQLAPVAPLGSSDPRLGGGRMVGEGM